MQFLTLARRLLALTVPLLLLASSAPAAIKDVQSTAQQPILEVFVRDGCSHCAEAEVFLSDFGRNRPWLQIVYHDPAARDELKPTSMEERKVVAKMVVVGMANMMGASTSRLLLAFFISNN